MISNSSSDVGDGYVCVCSPAFVFFWCAIILPTPRHNIDISKLANPPRYDATVTVAYYSASHAGHRTIHLSEVEKPRHKEVRQ